MANNQDISAILRFAQDAQARASAYAKQAVRAAAEAKALISQAAVSAAAAASDASDAEASAADAEAFAADAAAAASSIASIATVTPTPNKIPIAGNDGKLDDGWINGGGGGQDPSDVAITGGSITGVSLYGDSAALWQARAGYQDNFERFKRSAYASMIAGDPTLTGFEYLKIGTVPGTTPFGAFTNDAFVEGGAITAPNDPTQLGFGATVFQTMNLGHWAVFWEGKCTPGQTTQFGAQKVDASFGIWIGTHGSADPTHFHVRLFNATPPPIDINLSVLADTANHIFGIVDDGTTIRAYVDGVLAGSGTDRSKLAAGAAQLYFYNVAVGGVKVKHVAWGFING